MANRLDHFMWAASDLDQGIADFARLTGVTAGKGGVHPGMATRNALASLGGDQYLEIIAPDPAQKPEGTFAAHFLKLARPQIFAFIAKGSDLDRLKRVYAEHGIECQGPFDASRALPGGGLLRWKLLIPALGKWGLYAPIFIDWLDSRHPSADATAGCRITHFEVGHPGAAALAPLYRALDMAFMPVAADAPFMRAEIETPNGRLVLTGG